PLMRVRHRDDLAGIRGVGQHLLVAAHRGVEDGLPEGLPCGSERPSPEGRPVLEHEEGGRRTHRWAFPSCTTRSPRYIVWMTLPLSVRPRNAEFLLLEAKGGSTTHSASGSKATRCAGRPA